MSYGDGSMITATRANTLLQRLVMSTDRAGWDALSTSDQEIRLRQAQALIDAGHWDGSKADDEQLYAFPRIDDAQETIGSVGADDNGVPLAVQEALALLAWSLTDQKALWERQASLAAGLVSQAAGSISEAYTAPVAIQEAVRRLQVQPEVWDRLRLFWRKGGTLV